MHSFESILTALVSRTWVIWFSGFFRDEASVVAHGRRDLERDEFTASDRICDLVGSVISSSTTAGNSFHNKWREGKYKGEMRNGKATYYCLDIPITKRGKC